MRAKASSPPPPQPHPRMPPPDLRLPTPGPSRPRGVTLPELVFVLAIVAILSSIAVPSLNRYVDQLQVRGALDRVVAELYRARMLAVEHGTTARVVLSPGPGQCIGHLRTLVGTDAQLLRPLTVPLEVGSVCLRHNGDSVIIFNSRGMLRPPARSIFAVDAPGADSVVLSIAGRVRRSY